MPAQLLDGKVMAAELEEELKKRVEALKEKGYTPGLTVILVGDDPASQTYVSNKEKACARLGIRSRTLRMPADTTQETLEAAIREANADPSVNGILVQLPLPRHLDGDRALSLILPEKDVDGFHDINAGRLSRGLDCVVACTPKGALHMLKRAGIPISGKEAVHNNAEMMKVLRQDGQRAFEKTHTREEFMKLFGKNYLEETGG